jgi:DNA-binding transcriptional MerR regulator
MRIGEIANHIGVAASAIRFYEESGLIPAPERTASGYRDYTPAVIDRLKFIRAGQAVGLTLGELRDVLVIRDRGEAPCSHVSDLVNAHLDDIDGRIEDLQRLRRDLVDLAGEAASFDPTDCSPESVCRILTAPREPGVVGA